MCGQASCWAAGSAQPRTSFGSDTRSSSLIAAISWVVCFLSRLYAKESGLDSRASPSENRNLE